MAQYRLLADHWIGQFYFAAGTMASTSDVGGLLPANWTPSGNSEPLDTDAVNAFWNAGPQLLGLVRSQFSNQYVAPPVTYWLAQPQDTAPTKWTMTGLGAGLAPIFF
jgi:hypothetical protein